MALGKRFGSARYTSPGVTRMQGILQRARSLRSAGPGRAMPPTRSVAFGRRPGVFLRHRRMARGGFFKSLVKGISKVVSTVAKVPVIGAVAKAAVSSLPVVGQVVTAVGAFKKKTAVGVAASPVGGIPAASEAGTPPAPIGARAPSGRTPRRRKASRKPKRAKRAKAKRSGGGSAKQRAARARFAKAAKRGRIKKGQRL